MMHTSISDTTTTLRLRNHVGGAYIPGTGERGSGQMAWQLEPAGEGVAEEIAKTHSVIRIRQPHSVKIVEEDIEWSL